MKDDINLDDRTYADLVAEARALIPTLAPTWTDHNPSDPGIALVELFAWLTEMVLYRTNRITDQHYVKFLRLLKGPGAPIDEQDIDGEIRRTIAELRAPYRAVTPQDFEQLLLAPDDELRAGLKATRRIRRVRCLPERDLTAADARAAAPGHVSVVLLVEPEPSPPASASPASDRAFIQDVYLNKRRTVTTKVHVVEPRSVEVTVGADLYLRSDVVESKQIEDVRAAAAAAVARFLDPYVGGPAGEGWPFGRNLYNADLYALLSSGGAAPAEQALAGVEAVENVTLSLGGAGRQIEGGLEVSDVEILVPTLPDAKVNIFRREGTTWMSE
jgi:hypothetical protein